MLDTFNINDHCHHAIFHRYFLNSHSIPYIVRTKPKQISIHSIICKGFWKKVPSHKHTDKQKSKIVEEIIKKNEDGNERAKKHDLLPVLFRSRLKSYIDTAGIIESGFADGRSIVIKNLLVDIIVSVRFVGLDGATEAELISSPPFLTAGPWQF